MKDKSKLVRVKEYDIDTILNLFKLWDSEIPFPVRRKKRIMTIFDGYKIKTFSQRYELFLRDGVTCSGCGLRANVFALEKSPNSRHYYFNLYYFNPETGEEVLFTKDHILPKSKGGCNHIDNYAIMCYPCNLNKGDTYVDKK